MLKKHDKIYMYHYIQTFATQKWTFVNVIKWKGPV